MTALHKRPLAAAAMCAALAVTAGCGNTAAPSKAAPRSTAPAVTSPVPTTGTGPGAGAAPAQTSGTGTRTRSGPGTAAKPGAAAEAAALTDGRYPLYITAVSTARRQLTVNVIQFLTGAAADKAAKEDGAEVTDDYYIRDASPRLRTLPVVAGAPITVNNLESATTGSNKDVRTSLARLGAYRDLGNAVFRATVKGGRVIALSEIYVP